MSHVGGGFIHIAAEQSQSSVDLIDGLNLLVSGRDGKILADACNLLVKGQWGTQEIYLPVERIEESTDVKSVELDAAAHARIEKRSMTIRLKIVYGRLSIRLVRSAFKKSVGDRLQKFGGSDTKELLQRLYAYIVGY